MEGRSQDRHTQGRGPRSGGESQPPPTIPECLEGAPGAQDKSKGIGHLGEVVLCWLTHPQKKRWFAGFDDFLGVTASAIAGLKLPACESSAYLETASPGLAGAAAAPKWQMEGDGRGQAFGLQPLLNSFLPKCSGAVWATRSWRPALIHPHSLQALTGHRPQATEVWRPDTDPVE